MAAPSDTNFGKQRRTSKYMLSSAAFRFEVPKRAYGRRRRNFKSAALVPARSNPASGELRPALGLPFDEQNIAGLDEGERIGPDDRRRLHQIAVGEPHQHRDQRHDKQGGGIIRGRQGS